MNRDFLPYYMMYPFPFWEERDAHITRDLEYLQQMYPKKAKQYQKLVYETLNLLDYEGSVIYDEYPDKLQLERITETVTDKITRSGEADTACQDLEWIKELVQIIVYYEIYRRRHKEKSTFPSF